MRPIAILLALSGTVAAQHATDILRKRCAPCHSAARHENGLRLDSRERALEGGYSGRTIVPGNASASKLIQLVSAPKGMPPAGPRLNGTEIDTLRRWVDEGAPWPEGSRTVEVPRSKHWSFQPIGKPSIPRSAANPIDAFVLDRLEREGVQPSLAADRRTLIRRVSLDLIGLPPTPAEVAEFLADGRTDAYDRVVDRLLASDHFGEKWARHWLDLARYADSDGYEQDAPRQHAWRYRDWVIEAFNRNLPFDQFTIQQIAGDLLPGRRIDHLTATGFHRNTLTSREGGIVPEELRAGQTADRTTTVGSVWLGLTFECTRCQDHKYDPLTQRDFYRMYAFFNSLEEVSHLDPLVREVDAYLRGRPDYDRKFAEIKQHARVAEFQPRWEKEVLAAMADPAARLEWTQVLDYLAVYQDHGHEILRTPAEKRTPRQSHDLTRVFLKYPGPLAGWPEAKGVKFSEGFRDLEELDAAYPGLSEVPAIAERATPRATHVLLRGDFRSPGVEVAPGTPESLPGMPRKDGYTRLDLAQWLVARENPLTARVFVNRVWQELFGAGLVATPEDFGARGEAPSHPAMLDYLAAAFRDSGWDVKALIRLCVRSATYRQSTNIRTELQARDPANRLLARQNRLRLPAELIRDSALSASGLLNATVGGPSVKPPMPAGVLQLAYRARWKQSEGADLYRRGLYVHFQRSMPLPQLMNFDAPNSLVSCSRRERSVTPLQALNLMNDPVFVEAAKALGSRLIRERPGADFETRLRYAFELCFSRTPANTEAAAMKRYADSATRDEAGTWQGIAAVLMNTEEFITRE